MIVYYDIIGETRDCKVVNEQINIIWIKAHPNNSLHVKFFKKNP